MDHRAFETPSQREVRLVGIFIHTRSGHVEISASGSSGALGDPTAPRLGPISRASNGRPSESGRPGPWPGRPCRHCWRTTGTASTQWPTASTRLPANCWSGIATVGGRPGDGHRLFSAGISRSDRGAHAVRSTAGDPDPGLTRDNRECVIATVSYTHLRAHQTVLDLVCR